MAKVFIIIVLIFLLQMVYLSTLLLTLCTFMVFFHGASSHLFPQAALHLVTNGAIPKEYKRQASDNEAGQCVSDRLDALVHDKSTFLSDCISASILELDFNITDFNDSSILQFFFQTLCTPECGNIVLKVYSDCGEFDDFPGGEKFFIDICGTNQNGDFCYETFNDGLDLIVNEASCYSNYTSTGTCSCQFELSEAITNQGCCVDAYHDLLEKNVDLPTSYPGSLYRACNVNLPKGCNNSPLTASGTLPLISAFTTVLCALMLTTLLG